MNLADPKNVELFMPFFRGRTDVYARRWIKEVPSGYSPASTFNWDEFMVHKRRGVWKVLISGLNKIVVNGSYRADLKKEAKSFQK